MEIKRTFDIVNYQCENYPTKKCLNYKRKDEWHSLSTSKLMDIANQLSFGLLKVGIKKGDKIAIVSENRPEWVIVDLAVQQIGAVLVPLYPNIRTSDYQFIFSQTDVKMIFVSNPIIYIKVSEALLNNGFSNIFMFNTDVLYKSWKTLRLNYNSKNLATLKKYRDAVSEDDLLTIIYTSGTTGVPKGVMLTHKNIVFNVMSCQAYAKVEKGKFRALSFLPLNHIFERAGLYTFMYLGGEIYFSSHLNKIGEEIKQIKPHIFNTVPRVLEKVYDKILTKAESLGTLKKGVFNWAVSLALKYEPGQNQSGLYGKQLALADKLVFSKWREALGGNLLQINCAAAPLQPRLIRVFWAAGINLLEGYGLTETSPVVSVNSLEKPVVGTVGEPLKGVKVKISDSGEILVKGPNVMLGYYANPKMTDEVIKDGWFHTGDIGQLNSNYLRIMDRKKEMFRTSGGMYIAPQLIENKLKESIFIEQVMLIGEGKKFPSVLIVPNFDKLLEMMSKRFIMVSDNNEMVVLKEALKIFEKELEVVNKYLSKWEKIKEFRLLSKSWSVETGELAATLKMKRKFILSKYSEIIMDIYRNDRSDIFKDAQAVEEKQLEEVFA